MTLTALVCILVAVTLISAVVLYDLRQAYGDHPVLITNYSRKKLIDGSVSESTVLWRSVINGEKLYWEPTAEEVIEDQMDRGI